MWDPNFPESWILKVVCMFVFWKLKYFLKETKLKMLTRFSLDPTKFYLMCYSCCIKILIVKNTIATQVIKQNKANKVEYCFIHP